MSRKPLTYWVCIMLFCPFGLCIGWPSYCMSESSELKQGLGYHEVIGLLGSPSEKVEKESSRETLWIYEQRQLRFRNGKLYDWSLSTAETRSPLIAAEAKQELQPLGVENDVEVQEILSEIINDGSPAEEVDRKSQRRPKRR